MRNNSDNLLSVVNFIARKKNILFHHIPNAYQYDVVSCIEAAKARKVSITKEIKHILLRSQYELIMVHVQADKLISLRKIKRFLKIKNICQADLSRYDQKIFGRGVICPFIEPFWSMKHLVDVGLFNHDWMTSNDTTKRGYIIFDPKILKCTKHHYLGDFVKDYDASY
ncbi:MAG: hypothetical protein ACFFG0_37215 [Candidatus Thorarchaeota archaeon]